MTTMSAAALRQTLPNPAPLNASKAPETKVPTSDALKNPAVLFISLLLVSSAADPTITISPAAMCSTKKISYICTILAGIQLTLRKPVID
ncbi:MAG: hypothetical protein AAF413_02455 [Patescibacteria group bacterium]